ncbi:hypothetical protein B484DRAFT_457910 [Ochromonadaceae sp. CCMP2298]|nr:hypothetical protein B484DRAFT_457910 [Ochromonadaceae sp. CCMP2298]
MSMIGLGSPVGFRSMGGAGVGVGAVERRVKAYPTEKKAASARIRRADPMSEQHRRPNTSKASFGQAGARDRSVSDSNFNRGAAVHTSSSNTSHISHNSASHVSHTAHTPSYTSFDEEGWVCRKCGEENAPSPHCNHCATVRGADGKRGSEARLHRA